LIGVELIVDELVIIEVVIRKIQSGKDGGFAPA
jgi:hypothetical protein